MITKIKIVTSVKVKRFDLFLLIHRPWLRLFIVMSVILTFVVLDIYHKLSLLAYVVGVTIANTYNVLSLIRTHKCYKQLRKKSEEQLRMWENLVNKSEGKAGIYNQHQQSEN